MEAGCLDGDRHCEAFKKFLNGEWKIPCGNCYFKGKYFF